MASPTPPVVTPPPVMPPPYYVRRRRSMSGPLILIIIGVVFLLGNMHVVTWPSLGHLFARYWPVLLILWGGIRLAEYYSDRQNGYPPRGIGVGGVFLLIFLIMIGMGATSADHWNWRGIQGEVDVDDDFFGGVFGQNFSFTSTQQQDLNASINSLRVLSDRGDVTVSAWDDNRIKVDVTKKIRANDQTDANKVDSQSQPTITIEGNQITVNANTSGAGTQSVRSDLEIWVPKNLAADLAAHRGDVSIAGRNANVKVSSSRGDITVDNVTGNVELEQRKGDVRVSKVSGDVVVGGQVGDATISDISGSVKLNGDYFGDMNLSRVAKGVTFRSSRTDMELARLDGDLTMQSGDLRANNISGPMRLLTRSKDIHLDDLAGDLRIENSNGEVEVHSSKLGAVEIQNRQNDVRLVVPEKANFQVDLTARNGEISSDFDGIKVNTQRDASSASGSVGNGGPKVQVLNEHGNIEIRKAGQS